MRLAPVLLAGALALAGCGKSEPPADNAPGGEAAVETPAVAPTAAMGEQVFRRCVACHTAEQGGSNGIGPNLHGVVGAAVASKPDLCSARRKSCDDRSPVHPPSSMMRRPSASTNPETSIAFE